MELGEGALWFEKKVGSARNLLQRNSLDSHENGLVSS